VRLTKPRYIEEGICFYKCLLEHYGKCKNWKASKTMGKSGPSWVFQCLNLFVMDKSIKDIHHISTTFTEIANNEDVHTNRPQTGVVRRKGKFYKISSLEIIKFSWHRNTKP
jgi:hypothetical protein